MKNNNCLNMAALAALTITTTGKVAANSPKAAPQEIIVSTAHRSERLLSQDPRSVSVVNQDELQLVGATHISELAPRTPGVNIHRNNGQEYLASIRSPILTGAGACGAFLMAQDGIALRSAGFCNVNELFEGFTETAERIEITRGPGSALYGSNALHGIINIITPAADTDERYASIEAGSYGYGRLNASTAHSDGQHGFRLTATIARDGGYRTDSGYNQQKVGLRHDYTGSDWTISSNISVTNLDQETAGFITGPDAFKDRDVAKSNPNPEAFRKAKSLRYWSRLSHDTDNGLRWQITPYFRASDMEFLMHFLPGKPLETNSQISFGLQNGLYINEGKRATFIVGADLEYTRGSLEQTQKNPTQGSAFLQATIPAGKQYDYDVDSYMAAGFLQTDIALTDKVNFSAGVRIEHIKYDYTNNMLSGRTDENGASCGFGGCRYSRPESGSNSYTAFSPKLGLVYNYASDHHAYFNVSQGFRAPQATELYRLQRAQTVADLKKVSLKSVEAGLRGRSKSLAYEAAFYAMKKDNYIFRDSDFFNVSDGRSEHIGADIMIELALTNKLSLRGNLSIARHRYDFDYLSGGINLNGKDIDTAPRHFGGMQLTWTPTSQVKAELEWVHMGSYYLEPENLHKYGGHDYLNLRIAYQLSETASLFTRVTNITNTKYAERADYTSFTAERYFPGKPTSIYAGVKLGF